MSFVVFYDFKWKGKKPLKDMDASSFYALNCSFKLIFWNLLKELWTRGKGNNPGKNGKGTVRKWLFVRAESELLTRFNDIAIINVHAKR